MKLIKIQFNNQTLTLSSEDINALECALNQAHNTNQDIQQMTRNNGVLLVSSLSFSGLPIGQSLTPMDSILNPPAKPFYSANDVTLTDC